MYWKNEKLGLLIIDMQNAFLHEKGHLVIAGEDNKPYQRIIPNIKKIADTSRLKNIPVIYIRHAYLPNYADGGILVNELFPSDKEVGGWIDGTFGTEIYEELKPKEIDYVIRKNRYSSFFGTNLDQFFRNLAVNSLIITGIHSNVCCESTARDAVFRDYRVYFISDGTMASSIEMHESALRNISTYFGKVLSTEEIIDKILNNQ